jgi:hypothetical protein
MTRTATRLRADLGFAEMPSLAPMEKFKGAAVAAGFVG